MLDEVGLKEHVEDLIAQSNTQALNKVLSMLSLPLM